MKKFLVFILLLIFGSWAFLYTTKNTSLQEKGTTQNSIKNPPSTSTISNAIPETFAIPKLGITAPIESLGLDATGKMDVPKNADNVAWYNLGHHIGSNGSAVIAGHYDKVTGAPAVFYNLSKLTPGDTITVSLSDGKAYTYKVLMSKTYDHDKVPLKEIFDTQGKALLNLITCEGVFNKNTNLYSKRLVVYTELTN